MQVVIGESGWLHAKAAPNANPFVSERFRAWLIDTRMHASVGRSNRDYVAGSGPAYRLGPLTLAPMPAIVHRRLGPRRQMQIAARAKPYGREDWCRIQAARSAAPALSHFLNLVGFLSW